MCSLKQTRLDNMEKYIAKVGDRREFAQALHSYAQDLTYAASSPRHNLLFNTSCQEIIDLIKIIPDEENAKSARLNSIINQLSLTSYKKSNESGNDIDNERPKLANDFITMLNYLYPINIEYSLKPVVMHQSY